MALNDLNLEFEDEEEAKKPKKSDALNVDVDLEFQSPGQENKPRPAPRPAAPAAGAPARPPGAEIKKLDDARPAGAPTPIKRPMNAPARPVPGGAAPQINESYDLEGQEVHQMREQLKKVEFESAVKVAVAEFKTEILSELLGDMKLMEHQVGQLLVRMNNKHPDLKQEALTIKKLLADFTAKKRK